VRVSLIIAVAWMVPGAVPMGHAEGNDARVAGGGAVLPPAPFVAVSKPPASQGGGQQTPLVYSPRGGRYCGPSDELNGGELCFTGREGADAGRTIVTAALIEPGSDFNLNSVLRITLAPPLQLKYGVHLIIDEEQPIASPFVTCSASGCVADYRMTPELDAKLKRGKMLQIRAVNLAGKVINYPLPLSDTAGNGFRSAVKAPPSTDPMVFTERQKKLQAYVQMSGAPGALVRVDAPTVYSPWTKICGKGPGANANAKNVCFTSKVGRPEGGEPVVAAALIEPEGESKKLFRITLPGGLHLQYGTRLIIDGQQMISAAFFTCLINGCMADFEATAELVAKLKRGRTLQVQAISLAGNITTFPLPLADTAGDSFWRANEGPPADPKVFEVQQRRTEEQRKKREAK
jgi:invasion protein IalB